MVEDVEGNLRKAWTWNNLGAGEAQPLAHLDPIVLGLAGGVDGQLGAAFRLQVGDSDCSGAQNIGKLETAGLLVNPILRGLIQATS
jgi:hypothetical protein